jgi:peptidyl-prolyl cis-trans isomerase SurA
MRRPASARRPLSGPAALVAALLAAVPAALPLPARAVVLDRVAAVVGGEAITVSELDERWREIEARPDPDAPKTRADLLNRLIDLKLQLARARELGVEARPEEVEDALQRLMQDNGLATLSDLTAVLTREGRTLEDLRREVAAQLTRMHVIQRDVTARLHITDEAVRRYYDTHPDLFTRDRELTLRQIVFTTQGLDEAERAKVADAVAALRGQLTGPASFRAAEARLGGSPGVVAGAAGTFGEKDLRPELARTLLALGPGRISPPTPVPTGYGLFLVESVSAGTRVPFAEALPEVRDRVAAEETEARLPGWLADLKRAAHVEIKPAAGAPAG